MKTNLLQIRGKTNHMHGNMPHQKFGPDELSRILALLANLCDRTGSTPERAIEYLEDLVAPSQAKRRRLELPELVASLRWVRRKRNEVAGHALFRDPAWDMILELYCAATKGAEVSVSGLCYESGVPLTTALRHLARLEKLGLVEREGDDCDLRRVWVRPTPRGVETVERWASMLAERLEAIGAVGSREKPERQAA
jgi:DNA-binding MarR family transcriptional regulator